MERYSAISVEMGLLDVLRSRYQVRFASWLPSFYGFQNHHSSCVVPVAVRRGLVKENYYGHSIKFPPFAPFQHSKTADFFPNTFHTSMMTAPLASRFLYSSTGFLYSSCAVAIMRKSAPDMALEKSGPSM